MREVEKIDAIEMLLTWVQGCGSQRAAAMLLKISEAYLSDVLKGNRNPDSVLAKIGIKRVVRYQIPKRVGPKPIRT